MRFRLILFLFISSIFSFYAQDGIVGKWLTSDKKNHISIYKQSGKYFGRLTWIRDSINPKTKKLWADTCNPDLFLKSRQVLGLVLLKDFRYNPKKREYYGGTFYYPRNGKIYRGKMWLTDHNTLHMRGYVLVFYSTDVWKRVE